MLLVFLTAAMFSCLALTGVVLLPRVDAVIKTCVGAIIVISMFACATFSSILSTGTNSSMHDGLRPVAANKKAA
jgi:hypothetical protein